MEEKTIWAWGLFGFYVVATSVLALWGMKKTKGFKSFALGSGDLGPVLVGITLASSIASSATFIINPGFVYTHGLSAFFHFAVASPAGFLLALIIFSKRFRQLGVDNQALTLPQWIRNRYKNSAMGSYFAILNLCLSITFIVLIVKGSAIVMQHTLGLEYVTSLVIVVGFVFSYVLMGGTYAHAYTNALQGLLMVAVAIMLVYSGLNYFEGGFNGFAEKLAALNPNLVLATNPESSLFSNVWEVFVCSFIISWGLVCQPHILMKSLYLKNERQVNLYLVVGCVVSLIFASLLIAGLYARLSLGSEVAQDSVMALYITKTFSPILGVFISVALLAAGMSTLDGILVGASTIVANDIVMGPMGMKFIGHRGEADRERLALSISRWALIILGVVSFLIALNPPQLVGIFAQAGIYGLTAASIVPIAGGILFKGLSSKGVFASAIAGPLVHFSIYFYWKYVKVAVLNPAVSAAIGIAASVALMTFWQLFIASKTSVRTFESPEIPTQTAAEL